MNWRLDIYTIMSMPTDYKMNYNGEKVKLYFHLYREVVIDRKRDRIRSQINCVYNNDTKVGGHNYCYDYPPKNVEHTQIITYEGEWKLNEIEKDSSLLIIKGLGTAAQKAYSKLTSNILESIKKLNTNKEIVICHVCGINKSNEGGKYQSVTGRWFCDDKCKNSYLEGEGFI